MLVRRPQVFLAGSGTWLARHAVHIEDRACQDSLLCTSIAVTRGAWKCMSSMSQSQTAANTLQTAGALPAAAAAAQAAQSAPPVIRSRNGGEDDMHPCISCSDTEADGELGRHGGFAAMQWRGGAHGAEGAAVALQQVVDRGAVQVRSCRHSRLTSRLLPQP